MSPYLSRIRQGDHLAGKRGEIYQAICNKPGISFGSVREHVGMTGGGGPQYHLYVLEKLEYVQSFRVGRHRRYFAAGDEHYRRNRIRAILTSPIYRETASAVSRRPGAVQREIADEFPEVSRQAVSYRLGRLETAGAIARTIENRRAFYYATMDGGYVLDHLNVSGPV